MRSLSQCRRGTGPGGGAPGTREHVVCLNVCSVSAVNSPGGHGFFIPGKGTQPGHRKPIMQETRYDWTPGMELVADEEHLMVVWPGDMHTTFPPKAADDQGGPARFTWAWFQAQAEAAGCKVDCRGRRGRERHGVRDRANRPTRLTIRGPPSTTNELLMMAVLAARQAHTDVRSVLRQVPRMFDSWDPEEQERAEAEQQEAERHAEEKAGPPTDSENSDTDEEEEGEEEEEEGEESEEAYDEDVPDYGGDHPQSRKRRRKEAEAAEPPAASSATSSGGGGAPRDAAKASEQPDRQRDETPLEAAAEPPSKVEEHSAAKKAKAKAPPPAEALAAFASVVAATVPAAPPAAKEKAQEQPPPKIVAAAAPPTPPVGKANAMGKAPPPGAAVATAVQPVMPTGEQVWRRRSSQPPGPETEAAAEPPSAASAATGKAEVAAEPPSEKRRGVQVPPVAQAEYLVMCDSFLELINTKGQQCAHTSAVTK